MALPETVESDPFESILAMAQGVGFEIPNFVRSDEDVRTDGFLCNLHNLIVSGNSVLQMQRAIKTIHHNVDLCGFLGIERKNTITDQMNKAIEFFTCFERHKILLTQRITHEQCKSGVPVEIQYQQDFLHLIEAISMDKYETPQFHARNRSVLDIVCMNGSLKRRYVQSQMNLP